MKHLETHHLASSDVCNFYTLKSNSHVTVVNRSDRIEFGFYEVYTSQNMKLVPTS